MKTGSDALGTIENGSGNAKHENWTRRPRNCRKRVQEPKLLKRDPTPSVKPKISPGAQNMKKGPDVHDTAGKEFGSA
jgi:hypothetical protein